MFQSNITDKEHDQLVFACLEVYANELKDEKAANLFFEKLITEEAKFRANLSLKKLKEAYLIAAKMESLEYVKMVYQLAKDEEDSRVANLCEQYLTKTEKKDPNEVELKVVVGENK